MSLLAKKSVNAGDSQQLYFGKICVRMLQNMRGVHNDIYCLLSLLQDSAISYGPWFQDLNSRLRNECEDASYYSQATFLRSFVDKKYLENIVDVIREHRPELFTPTTLLEASKIVGSLLDLNPFEIRLLDLSARLEDRNFTVRSVFTNWATRFSNKELMFEELLDSNSKEVREGLTGILVQGGILVTDSGNVPHGFFGINEDMRQVFEVENLSHDNIDAMLFPSMLNTELTIEDDYNHVEKEVRWSVELINRNRSERAKGRRVTGTNVIFWGAAGCGKTELAVAMARENGWDLKVIGDISPQKMNENSRHSRLASLKMATKIFRNHPNTVLLFDEMEDLFKTDNNANFSKAFINRIIETTEVPIIWTTNSLLALGQPVLRRMLFNIEFAIPKEDARAKIWTRYCDRRKMKISPEAIERLAKNYPLAPALISNAVDVAKTTFGRKKITDKDLHDIVASMHKLVNYGYAFGDDLVISEEPKKTDTYDVACSNTDVNLENLVDRLVNARDKGFSLCLYGAPGTGKSEFGRHIAKKMGKDVLFKRASDLQSMWVGQCEKNIAKAFKEAKDQGKILIIDEGDTFLRDRTMARASWEVSQVNEMLSQMETHTQPFVLTTNLMQNIDSAALRRFTFKCEFKYMEASQARRLFRRFFKVDAPPALDRNQMLTPGDYANVKRQCDILGITDAENIWQMVEEETKLKPNRKTSIGF